ncbi:hypothetical protein D9757_013485 [Collybiopsis confluens]|uniref:Protein kinase domain-containing protein n=1 Tax=Collybiopsis confluens TaxID=2823264 RepID=A0A8H5FRU4_9AGAR|nr:hypothetical protein D9757_013485 [Collybiopsis confluens]
MSIQYEPGRLGGRANRPTWLLSKFEDQLTDADKKVTITAAAIHNEGIWNVKSYKGYSGSPGDLLLKILSEPDESNPSILDYNYGEVKVLKQVGDFVASGYIKDPRLSTLDKMKSKIKSKPLSRFRVVIMKRKDGKSLPSPNLDDYPHSSDYPHLSNSQFKKLAESVKRLACEAASEIAVNREVLHGDLQVGNILFKMSLDQRTPASVNLVDWGTGNWVSKGVKKDEVLQYCLENTIFYRNIGVRRGVIAEGGESGF